MGELITNQNEFLSELINNILPLRLQNSYGNHYLYFSLKTSRIEIERG